jgi:hypothetical protein
MPTIARPTYRAETDLRCSHCTRRIRKGELARAHLSVGARLVLRQYHPTCWTRRFPRGTP